MAAMNVRQTLITIMAITAIAALQICAFSYGIDGPSHYVSLIAIAGLGGYQIHQARSK